MKFYIIKFSGDEQRTYPSVSELYLLNAALSVGRQF
jgi:tRNA U54 and U55 pseudouridine synthase Pus10